MKQTITFNSNARQNRSLVGLALSIWLNRQLIIQLTKREIVGRYKGSYIGVAWSLFNPILMLGVYTVVFSEVFKSRWPGTSITSSKADFAIVLFIGMIVLNLFSEVLNKSPTLILNYPNYVKKVVFPLEILPIVSMGVALFHCAVSICVLLIAFVAFNGFLHSTAALVPLILLPLVFFSLGLSWALASLGVFLRDISQTVSSVPTILMFLSPVFYPVSAVPERYRPIVEANPLTFIIEQARQMLFWGGAPEWHSLALYLFASLVIAWLGFAWFQSTRTGFSDVL